MAKIENEIVKFIAEVELDPQSAAEYTKGLQDAERHNEALRQSISDTVRQMDEMRASGKENTQEFKAHKEALEADVKALKESAKQAEKYSAALGINSMNYNQLVKHAKQVRSAMNSVHKEANPKLWEKYNKELVATQKRMDELRGGAQQTGSVLSGMSKKIIPTFDIVQIGIKAVNAVVGLVRKGFKDLTTETQKLGDVIQAEIAAANAVWHHFIRNITASKDETVLAYKEVANLAREAAKLKDEIFELQNSYDILSAESLPRMQELEAVFRDSSRPIEERRAALEEMKALEKQLAEDRLTIARQEEEAAYDLFRIQTGLDREMAEAYLRDYLTVKKNGMLDEVASYDALKREEKGLMAAMTSGMFVTDKTYRNWQDRLNEVRESLAGASEDVIRLYNTQRQYNLGNDDITGPYAKSITGRIKAEAEASDSFFEAKYARLNSQLSGGGSRGGNSAYQQRIKAADDAYKREQVILKNALLEQEITQEQYNARILAAEIAMYETKVATARQYGEDALAFEISLADKRMDVQRRIREVLDSGEKDFSKTIEQDARDMQEALDAFIRETEASIEAELSEIPDPAKRMSELADKALRDEMKSRAGKIEVVMSEHDAELRDLNDMHNAMLISEEEYLARKKALHEDTARQIAEINLETWVSSFQTAAGFLQQASELVSSLRDAEIQKLDAQKERELAIAGDNAEARQAIEEEYEEKKLSTEKKYADADMAINIARTIAEGAVAAMKAFADLGPVAGAVMAGLLAATTVAQVAVITAQRNAIKNASASSAGFAGISDVVGFSEGGYTGPGGRLEPAGIVHRGEYVVAAPELRDPEVARQVAGIERRRIARTSGHYRLPGYVDGGYTAPVPSGLDGSLSKKLDDVIGILLDIHDNPIPAYMLASQWESEIFRIERHKRFSSLRRNDK